MLFFAVETSLESVSFIFYIFSILQISIYAFTNLNFQKSSFSFYSLIGRFFILWDVCIIAFKKSSRSLINYRSNHLGNTILCYSCTINIYMKQIEISFERYIRYQWKFHSVVKRFFYWSYVDDLHNQIWIIPSVIGLVEQYRRAGTYVKFLSKMELIYWTCLINHGIPHWGITFLTIQVATVWTNSPYS